MFRNAKKSKTKKPKYFEMMPERGQLNPDERVNVQVKFMPTEEVSSRSLLFLILPVKVGVFYKAHKYI